MKKLSIAALAAALLAGCFTISQSEYPQSPIAKCAGEVKLRLEGFAATMLVYVPAWAPGGYAPMLQPTDAYRDRAMDSLERAGFLLRAAPADYSVAVEFAHGGRHPDFGWHVAETLGSLTFAFRGGEVWTAKLKVYDAKSGKCVFVRDYRQTYEAHGWSFVPLFGFLDYDELRGEYVKGWCLNALTDRAVADAASFVASAQNDVLKKEK